MHTLQSFSWRITTLVIAGTLAATVQSTPSHSYASFSPWAKKTPEDQAVIRPVSPVEAASCSRPVNSNPSTHWLDQQDHAGNARGYAPFLPGDFTYPVYRNVKSYHAVGDGNADDTQNLQNAINDDGKGGNRYNNEVSTRPAEIFVPEGTYRLTKQLDLRLNTILVGDPNNMPIFKASSGFSGGTVVNGYDYATHDSGGTTAFFIAMKNIIIDTTSIAPDTQILALQWGVAQACQLTNIKINMPTNSRGHTGIALDQGSTIAITDVVSQHELERERILAKCCSPLLEAPLVFATPINKSISNLSPSQNVPLVYLSQADSLQSYRMLSSIPAASVSMAAMGDHQARSSFSTRRQRTQAL